MDGFGKLIAGTGDLLGIEGLEPDADGVCILESEEAQILVIDCPEAGDMVFVTATLMPVLDDASSAYLAALDANHRFKGTRGGTVSLDSANDTLVLSRYVPLDSLTPESFVALLEEFSSVLICLRDTLCDTGETRSRASADEQESVPHDSIDTINLDDLPLELDRMADDSIIAIAELGALDAGEDGDAPILREFMEANHLFAGTAGATLSIERDTRHAFLQQALYTPPGNDEDWLPRRLAIFAGKATEWKTHLEKKDAPPDGLPPFSGNFMQV
ncbi:MAG: type III secretion system chaperone [Kiritimatiellae bacterium]|nr:type III secretion system chaperone [Kiritimatiellia bacterium]